MLEAWKAVEQETLAAGGEGDVDSVIRKLPIKTKMRRMVAGSEDSKEGVQWEEYYDYHFPDDEKKIGKFISHFIFNLL